MASKDSNDKRPSFLKVYPHRNKTLGDRANLLLSLYISRFELFEKKGELRDFPEGKGFYITWKYIQNFLNWSEGLARRQDAALEELGLVKHRLDKPNTKQLRRYVILRFDWIQRMDEEALQLGVLKQYPQPDPHHTVRGIKTIPPGVLKQYPGGYQNNTLKLDVNKLDQKKGSSSAKPTTAAHSSNRKNPKPQRPEQEGREMYGTTWTSKKPRGPLFPVKEPAEEATYSAGEIAAEAEKYKRMWVKDFLESEEGLQPGDDYKFREAARKAHRCLNSGLLDGRVASPPPNINHVKTAFREFLQHIDKTWPQPVVLSNLASDKIWQTHFPRWLKKEYGRRT